MRVGTRLLTAATGERFRFDAGCFCLELLITGGPGPYQRYEILHEPADLARWLEGSRLAEVAPLSGDDIRIQPAELRRIKRFRGTMWSIAKAVAHGERPSSGDLEVLNDSAEPPPRPRLDPATGVRQWASPVTGGQILGAAAREAIELLGGERVERLRECAADDCSLLFLDTSRPGSRRWCSMQRCGNRHKVNAHRARRT
ncbi:ABATE domain-containing protein [Saccharopolyspora shandongensis]|uniref:CGNR zinc finger domain-containing protein n=1 Tax=Saccharopolyspora shandongensis TaxID=418495 RepID=UPI00342CC8C4